MTNCEHSWEPYTLTTKMRCEHCGVDAPRRTFADQCLDRAETATEGPWSTGVNKPWIVLPAVNMDEYAIAACDRFRNNNELDYPREDNAQFIAHARTDVPELARRLKRACTLLRIIHEACRLDRAAQREVLAVLNELEAPTEEK